MTTSFSEEERGQRESDVNKLVRKISLYIKNKLTEEDSEILDSVFEALEKTALITKSKIIADLDRHMELTDASDDDDVEKKDDVEKTEKDDEEPKKESLHDNFHKRKLKKKIREMIRTAVLKTKFKK